MLYEIIYDSHHFLQYGHQTVCKLCGLYMLCRSLKHFHFYSRKLSDRVEHHLSYLQIFLWLLETKNSLRNRLYSQKSRKIAEPITAHSPGQLLARYITCQASEQPHIILPVMMFFFLQFIFYRWLLLDILILGFTMRENDA